MLLKLLWTSLPILSPTTPLGPWDGQLLPRWLSRRIPATIMAALAANRASYPFI